MPYISHVRRINERMRRKKSFPCGMNECHHLIIEAKLMMCKLIYAIIENVKQHKAEIIFACWCVLHLCEIIFHIKKCIHYVKTKSSLINFLEIPPFIRSRLESFCNVYSNVAATVDDDEKLCAKWKETKENEREWESF
jgi:hypothetical protein